MIWFVRMVVRMLSELVAMLAWGLRRSVRPGDQEAAERMKAIAEDLYAMSHKPAR